MAAEGAKEVAGEGGAERKAGEDRGGTFFFGWKELFFNFGRLVVFF